jgi:hypothetical protein
MMEYCILYQPNLYPLYGLKYNTLPFDDMVMINERYTIIKPKTISYSPMCLTQVPIICISGACSAKARYNRALYLLLNSGTGRSSIESSARSSPNVASYFGMNSGSMKDGSTSITFHCRINVI